jgi:Zn-dependent peptidase ImmA (M78 family)/transcriptional regulator with XRE-family HTH domain
VAATYAHIPPEVLRWARESTGYSVLEAAGRIGVPWSRLEAAEEGDDLLTLRQAEKAADVYERPLAALFMPAPPEEEPAESQFRRLPGAPELPWPPQMHLLARRVRDRQQAAAELYEVLDEEPPWREAVGSLRARRSADLAPLIRDVLGVDASEQESWTDSFAALRAWTDAVEGLGVLVMQDGSMPLDVLRGFASVDPDVPAVVINNKDDPRARAFTIIHELAHLLLAVNGLEAGNTEATCNEIAGEVLMPRPLLIAAYGAASGPLSARVEQLARRFTVTPLAAAVRLIRAGIVPRREGEAAVREIRNRPSPDQAERRGGDYYWNEISRLGPAFIRLVMSALDNQAVSYPTASSLLGNVKVNNFDTLRSYLNRRAATS